MTQEKIEITFNPDAMSIRDVKKAAGGLANIADLIHRATKGGQENPSQEEMDRVFWQVAQITGQFETFNMRRESK